MRILKIICHLKDIAKKAKIRSLRKLPDTVVYVLIIQLPEKYRHNNLWVIKII